MSEMARLARLDQMDLWYGMDLFQEAGRESSAIVDKYADHGIWRLKRSRAGRLLFVFTDEYEDISGEQVQILSSLVVFKKESKRTPTAKLKLAQARNK